MPDKCSTTELCPSLLVFSLSLSWEDVEKKAGRTVILLFWGG